MGHVNDAFSGDSKFASSFVSTMELDQQIHLPEIAGKALRPLLAQFPVHCNVQYCLKIEIKNKINHYFLNQ